MPTNPTLTHAPTTGPCNVDAGHAWPRLIAHRHLRQQVAVFWHDELGCDGVDDANFLGDTLTTVLVH